MIECGFDCPRYGDYCPAKATGITNAKEARDFCRQTKEDGAKNIMGTNDIFVDNYCPVAGVFVGRRTRKLIMD